MAEVAVRGKTHKSLWGGVFCLLIAAFAGGAAAHELEQVELRIQQLGAQHFAWGWVTRGVNEQALQDLRVQWPSSCQADGARLQCGPDGLQGRLQVDGMGTGIALVAVRVSHTQAAAGAPTEQTYALTPAQPDVRLEGVNVRPNVGGDGAESARAWRTLQAYGWLGVEHILTGFDHLMFVCSLMFLVGLRRRLVLAITAFTLAHSLTLVLASLNLVKLPPAPVEACIALSIVLVSAEALSTRATWTRRWPQAVAFVFGLVHGLGFAGALAEIGLPRAHTALALLAFNVGVEAGQLLVIGGMGLGALWVRRQPWCLQARSAVLTGFGSVAAYWTMSRVWAIWMA